MSRIKKPASRIIFRLRGYLFAILLVALATWLKYLAQPDIIPPNVPILYLMAIVPTAILFGLGPSILVCVSSLVAFDFFFTPPLNQFDLFSFRNGTFLVIFFLVGIAISFLSSNLRKKNELALKEIAIRKQNETDLANYRNQLEEMVKQRTIKLQASEQRWATTLASVGDGVIVTDVAGTITFMNPTAEELTGWRLHEAVNKPIAEVFCIINEQTRQIVDNPVAKVLEKGLIVGLANHTILIRQDGTEFAIGDSGAPVKTEEGRTTGVVLVFRDVSEQKKGEAALEASEIRFRRLFETAKDGILILEFPSGRITSVNPFLKDLLGYNVDEMLGKQLWEIGSFKDILASKEAFLELQNKRYIRYEDLPLKTKDGRPVNVEFVSNVYSIDHTEVIQCNIRDITERKKAEESIQQYARELESHQNHLEEMVQQRTQELQTLSYRLITAQEEERRHISRELHDQTGQSLTVLNLMLAKALRSPETSRANIQEALQTVKEVLAQVRNLSSNLHPGMLEDLGLLPTLNWYLSDFSKKTGINVNFTHSGLNQKFSGDINITTYRVIQEAITNIARYAEVQEALVELRQEDQALIIRVGDKGKGFNLEPQSKGLGLRGIRERVSALNGRLNIQSSPGEGTLIEVELPTPM